MVMSQEKNSRVLIMMIIKSGPNFKKQLTMLAKDLT